MISLKEIVKPQDLALVDDDIRANLTRLHYVSNVLRIEYGKPIVINRGFSSPAEQVRIYQAKGQPPKMGSCHLIGAAIDGADPQKDFQKWLLERIQLLEELQVYCEAFDATPTWVHWQIYPPASGRRFFEP